MLARSLAPTAAAPPADGGPVLRPTFDRLYEDYFPFVWRTLGRLGVGGANVADAAQDVFIVVHRRLDDLHGDDVARSWVYGIVVRIAREYRRKQQRGAVLGPIDLDQLVDPRAANAQQALERAEAVALLDSLLATLDDEKREVLVLTELEQMSVPESAQLLGINSNTLYTRLRAARQEFERALERHHARQGRRQ